MNNQFFTMTSDFLPIFAVFIVVVALGVLLYIHVRQNLDLDSRKVDELYFKIKEDIKYAVAPKFMELSSSVSDLVELATEIWRIEQRILKSESSLLENQRKGLEISLKKLKRYLEKYDIEIVDHTNQKYNDGLNLDILSVEKNKSVNEPIIKETVEPTIMCKGQIIRKAKIVLLDK